MNNVLYSELLVKEMSPVTALTILNPAESENTYAILAARDSVIEPTLHSTISEQAKRKFDLHWSWSIEE